MSLNMGAHPTPNPPKPTKISRLKTFLDQLDPHPWDFDFDEPGFQPRPFFARRATFSGPPSLPNPVPEAIECKGVAKTNDKVTEPTSP
ncbi:uncharacterized protein EHS24_000108 [Apiotrichum porosum]|uniref:Uncharacterized protein n=1 Tax=Apiotrichum porosum TaxID=105984 RepID=A0A427Y918_9TREE|nr:uncharacterized protein EHS24_000108 [Apiotrichum porosum]RSH87596.1 hypothetical protein EHS24_000108 [Apiotrichum porosum]